MSPAPAALLRELAAAGRLTAEQAELAARVPVACDITAEADSGGHTDNRAFAPLFASIQAARRQACADHGLDPATIRIGLAGGIGTPHAAAAAFTMGADYILTGSVNQSCVESGLPEPGRRLLAKAGPADVMMTPAADMFEQGVRVQVLKRGTLFGPRGNRLVELYRSRDGLHAFSPDERAFLEEALGESLEAAWAATRDYLARANPAELARAEADPKKQMALIFRRYLFMGAQWARAGDTAHAADFQIWCGPAMGAFNEWVAGSALEPLAARRVAVIGWNFMEGAARLIRAQQARAMGVEVPPSAFDIRPADYAVRAS